MREALPSPLSHPSPLTEKPMFSHVMLGVNDLEVSKKFYDTVLGTLGKLYLAYLRDPDGNKLCALHRPAKVAT
jgi:hypothetical protein